jgi:octaprenyl-diphosphate synthase
MSEELKQKILSNVENDLQEIELALVENLNPYLELVSEIAHHILFSGGKRLRPLLMVLSARLCGYNGNNAPKYSTIFEYLHAATLLHDDLVDDAAMRRGKPVANSVWDTSTAVLVGDFLLARSLSIASETGRTRIIKVIAGITENMSQGEIQQLMRKGALDLNEEEYMEVIRRKTAVLFQGACRMSAILTDMPQNKEKALAKYGLNLGLAFQMADDLLDYTVDSAMLGKLVGADLREGKLTLPVIWALDRAGDNDRRQMIEIIKNKDFSTDEFESLISMLHKHGGIDYTIQCAIDHIQQAKQALSVFEDSAPKEILLDIADYALARKM